MRPKPFTFPLFGRYSVHIPVDLGCVCVWGGGGVSTQGMQDVTSPKELRLPTHLPRALAMKKGTWAWGWLT